jgi:hypothetical protein
MFHAPARWSSGAAKRCSRMKEPEMGRTRCEVARRAWLRRCVIRGVEVSRVKSLLGWRVRRAAREMARGPQENWATSG